MNPVDEMVMSEARCSLWPHDHQYTGVGPFLLTISRRAAPAIAHLLTPTDLPRRVGLQIEQPEPSHTNLTLLRLLIGDPDRAERLFGVRGDWNVTRVWLKQQKLELRIKARLTRPLPCPVPHGIWKGFCKSRQGLYLLGFQSQTLRRVPQKEERRIILPEDVGGGKRSGRIIVP